jgi:hypothetical protein
MYAGNNDLEKASTSCEYWGLGGAGAVVLAVIAEVVIACVEPPYNAFLTDSAIADVIIALGITVEVVLGTMWNGHIQSELRKRLTDKLTIATNRAARAEEQLAPRNVTKEQFEELQTLKGKVTEAVWITSPSDFEAAQFALQIAQALLHAGIDVRIAHQRIGMIWPELYIVLPEVVADFRNVPLFAAISKAGFSVGCGVRAFTTLGDIPKDDVVIMVGTKKPLSGDVPPFMAGLATPR